MKSVEQYQDAVSTGAANWAQLYKILYDLLERRQYLIPFAREYNLIDDTLKQYFSGVPNFSIGEYKVHGFYQETESFRIPDNLKAKYARKDKKWTVEISKQK